MSRFKDKLAQMVETIKEEVVDFSSLEVTTLTGEISHFMNAKGKFDLDKIKDGMVKKGNTKAKLTVVAHTHMAFDQDTVLFTKKDMTEAERELFDLHFQMIAAARVSRIAFLHMIREVLD